MEAEQAMLRGQPVIERGWFAFALIRVNSWLTLSCDMEQISFQFTNRLEADYDRL